MQRGARFFQKKAFPCSVALVLGFPTWAPSARGRTRRGLHESAPMQRGAHFFPKKAFPCSAPLKVLSVTSAPARSRVTFSSIWGFVVFCVLHVLRSGALFSDSPWPSFSSLEVMFFRFGAKVLFRPH